MYSLHPVTVDDVRSFLTECGEQSGRSDAVRQGSMGLERMERKDARGPDLASHALASYLAERRPSFAFEELSFSKWEAMIERGVGMLMRPPSRLFADAGMTRDLAQRFPIRLDHGRGAMAGAYVPAHLVPELAAMLEDRLERQVRRLIEAEIESVATMGLMLEAVGYAHSQGTGLIEADEVLRAGVQVNAVYWADKRRLPEELRKRLEAATRAPKKPGLISRLRG